MALYLLKGTVANISKARDLKMVGGICKKDIHVLTSYDTNEKAPISYCPFCLEHEFYELLGPRILKQTNQYQKIMTMEIVCRMWKNNSYPQTEIPVKNRRCRRISR